MTDSPPTESAETDELIVGTSLWADAFRRLRRNTMSMIGLCIVLFFGLACLVGPWLMSAIWGFDGAAQDLELGATPPSMSHWFGTDYYGRDSLIRTLGGMRISLAVGFLAAGVAAFIGIVYGAVSGFFGGRIDNVMMRAIDVMYALPYMFLVIILVTIFGKSMMLLFVALGFVGWLTTGRIVRGQVLSIKEREFVQAARSLGVRPMTIIFRHLIPNTLGPIIVYFTLTVPSMILQEAFLSFLGLGVQEPASSLGALINDGASQMLIYWWLLVFPGVTMAVLLFSLNFLGDGLRDALDPQMKR